MQKFIISLLCCLLPAFAIADVVDIKEGAPDRHVVVKGDTLWDISATFFKTPWKWPEIWGWNKNTIKDPHWIYPGDVVVLDRNAGTLKVVEAAAASAEPAAEAPANAEPAAETPAVAEPKVKTSGHVATNVVKLSPKVRAQNGAHDSIPVIPADALGPFLSHPLVVGEDELAGAPRLVGTYEQRVILGNDDTAYVKNLPNDKGLLWQAYRPGKALIDPDSKDKEVLGYEVVYLGDAKVEKFGELSTLRITRALQEINKGDRFAQSSGELNANFVPHAPDSPITGRVISIYGGVSQAGQYAVVTINKGLRDGLENGHVLALYRKGEALTEPGKGFFARDVHYDLPDTRYGLLFVFRTFEKVAYALVMQTTLPVEVLDRVQTP